MLGTESWAIARVRARRRSGVAAVVLVAVASGLLGSGPPARATHISGALYTGTHSGRGGAMEFQVSPDWVTVTRFKVVRVPIPLGPLATCFVTFEPASLPAVPITDHAFSQQVKEGSVTLTFAGTFSGPQQASGTLELDMGNVLRCGNSIFVTSGSWKSGPLTWTAATTAPPPASAPPVLSGPATQRAGAGKVVLVADCELPCTLTATGSVSVPGAAGGRRLSGATRVFPLGQATASLGNPGETQLTLAIPTKARAAIKKALAQRKKVVATVTVAADYTYGTASATRKIRLTR